MKLAISSDRSGSGKSAVLHILEDQGYYRIDNLPANLLLALANRVFTEETPISNVAVSIDARNISADLELASYILSDIKNKNIQNAN